MEPSHLILGIDEVGRGPWAGPLVIGAVILGDDFPSDIQLTDSKKLTSKHRDQLYDLIKQHAYAYATGWVPAAELDRIGLSASLKLATRRAVKPILHQLKSATTKSSNSLEIIIDGTVNFLQNTPLKNRVSTLKKADFLVREVSAASILAKVERDRYMAKIALQHPAYGFEKHVGYGTALHKKALLEHGICPEHRQSFRPIREIVENAPRDTAISNPPTSSQKGQTAELAVASYLKTQNHQIIAHNFKTKTYEIDLISIKNDKIYFTEVKYSENPTHEGTPLIRITPEKQQQMRYAAEKFLSSEQKLIQEALEQQIMDTADTANTLSLTDLQPFLAVAAVSGTNYEIEDWFVIQ